MKGKVEQENTRNLLQALIMILKSYAWLSRLFNILAQGEW